MYQVKWLYMRSSIYSKVQIGEKMSTGSTCSNKPGCLCHWVLSRQVSLYVFTWTSNYRSKGLHSIIHILEFHDCLGVWLFDKSIWLFSLGPCKLGYQNMKNFVEDKFLWMSYSASPLWNRINHYWTKYGKNQSSHHHMLPILWIKESQCQLSLGNRTD